MRGQDSYINKLSSEADQLKSRLQQVEDSKYALNNNRQLKESTENYERQISGLENDKVSLMKRLNMVLSELERATHEKSEINAKLLEQERMADELKRKLDEVSSLKNVVNRNLQDDLRYERELNEKLRDELSRFDREKDQLLSRLKEQEEVSKEIQRETSAINQNLSKKNEELKRLERDHELQLGRLHELNSQLEGLRQQERFTMGEKSRMNEELDHLTHERNELIRRMNELSDKYEQYVNTMNRERIEIMRANQQHVKLLTSKLLFQILQDAILSRRKNAFQEIGKCTQQMLTMEKALFRFSRILGTYGQDTKRHYIRLWYRNSMDFLHEHYKKINLIEYNVNKKRKMKFYYQWRRQFLFKRKLLGSKIDGLKVLQILLEGKQDLGVRKYLNKWRDYVKLRDMQGDFMYTVCSGKRQKDMRHAFIKWLGFVKRQDMDEKYEKMSQIMTTQWFKQRVFLAFKQVTFESKTESAIQKFKAWRNWCDDQRKKKYFQRKKQLVDRLGGTRTERLIKQCYDAIRYSNMNDKFKMTREQLDCQIPIRRELEKKKETLEKVSAVQSKHRLFRKAAVKFTDAKFRAFQVWKENMKYQDDTMTKIKLRLIQEHRRRCSHYFFKWKESIDKKQMVEMVGFSEEVINENQELTNTLQGQQKEKEQLADCSGRQKSSKLERVRNMLNRNLQKRRFFQWRDNASYICDIDGGMFLTEKLCYKRRLRNAFNKFRVKAGEVKREAYVHSKVDWFDLVRARTSKNMVFDTWKTYVRTHIRAKKYLTRGIKAVTTSMANDAFEMWKKFVFAQRKQVFVMNIEELESRQAEHEEQIKALDKEIQNTDCSTKTLQSKLKAQSQKIMANFISRSIHYQQAKGFFTWLENLKDCKKKSRFLKTTLNYWLKNANAKAFRTWADYTYKHKENELQTKYQTKEKERKDLQRLKDQEENAQVIHLDQLNQQVAQNTQLKEQLQQNFDKALSTHVNRMKNNVYVNKLENIFLTWAKFIKQERNAINCIGAIARKNLRMEVFSRIRLVARENYLEVKAEKTILNFARMFKSRLLLRSFSKWRINNYGLVVTEMNQRDQSLKDLQEQQAKELQNMEQQKQNKAIKILKQKRQREIAQAWIEIAKREKQLRVKQGLLKENVHFMDQRWAVKRWYMRVKKTTYLRRRDDQVVKKYQNISLKSCLLGWRKRVEVEKSLYQKTIKFYKRLNYLDIAHCFQQLVHYKKSLEERKRESKEHGNKSIYNSLNRLLKKRMLETLLALKIRGQKKEFKENFLSKVFQRAIKYRQRYYFGKWKHVQDQIKLTDFVNTEGNVVLERNQMKRNVQALKDFLMKQGYSKEEIEQYLKDKGQQQKNNMQKAIISFFFKNSDFSIMPKALNQWKRWVQARKLMRNWAEFVQVSMKHPLFWFFRRWKHKDEHSKQKITDLPKKDLIEKIITDELAIGSAQSRLSRMEDQIENLELQRESLLQHFISGQRLALTLGKNNHLKSMFRAFIQWKRQTFANEQERLAEQLDRTNQMINDLMNHVNKLENMNRGLTIENEELRQAALDGIEIAKAVQELTKEREQLSVDLQDRSSTIKKLIEDNNSLSMRLSIAQREAEQLEQLNQQVYMAPPEREYY